MELGRENAAEMASNLCALFRAETVESRAGVWALVDHLVLFRRVHTKQE